MREGLLPADCSHWILGGQKVVWLTQVPTLKPTRQAREALLRRGIWFKANSSLPNATVCLEVRISANDERLKKVVPWMRKQLPFCGSRGCFALCGRLVVLRRAAAQTFAGARASAAR